MAIVDYIPRPYQKGFGIILNLSKKDFDELYSNIENLVDSYSVKDLSEQIVKANKSFTEDNIKQIVIAIRGLTEIIENSEDTIEETLEDIFDIIKEGNAEDIIYNNQNKEDFQSRVKKLLESKAIENSSKAIRVLTANQNNFLFARIITDIRPIFNTNVEETPKSAVIVHNLQLHYQDSHCAEHKDIFISLDSKDVQALKDALARAEKKERNLKSMLQNINLKLLY